MTDLLSDYTSKTMNSVIERKSCFIYSLNGLPRSGREHIMQKLAHMHKRVTQGTMRVMQPHDNVFIARNAFERELEHRTLSVPKEAGLLIHKRISETIYGICQFLESRCEHNDLVFIDADPHYLAEVCIS